MIGKMRDYQGYQPVRFGEYSIKSFNYTPKCFTDPTKDARENYWAECEMAHSESIAGVLRDNGAREYSGTQVGMCAEFRGVNGELEKAEWLEYCTSAICQGFMYETHLMHIISVFAVSRDGRWVYLGGYEAHKRESKVTCIGLPKPRARVFKEVRGGMIGAAMDTTWMLADDS